MKKKFAVKRKNIVQILVIIVLLIVVPGVVIFSYDVGDLLIKGILFAVIYGAFFPLIFMLFRLVIRYMNNNITVTGDSLNYNEGYESLVIPWSSITKISYDFFILEKTSAGPGFKLGEVMYDTGGVRFYTEASMEEAEEAQGFSSINCLSKRTFSLERYGLYLSSRQFKQLMNLIRDYSGKEPQLVKGLFES